MFLPLFIPNTNRGCRTLHARKRNSNESGAVVLLEGFLHLHIHAVDVTDGVLHLVRVEGVAAGGEHVPILRGALSLRAQARARVVVVHGEARPDFVGLVADAVLGGANQVQACASRKIVVDDIREKAKGCEGDKSNSVRSRIREMKRSSRDETAKKFVARDETRFRAREIAGGCVVRAGFGDIQKARGIEGTRGFGKRT